MRSLCSGVIRLKCGSFRGRARQFSRRHAIERAPVGRAMVRIHQPQLPADRLRGQLLIAGEHDGSQAGPAQPRDRLFDIRGRRILETHQADEGEIGQRSRVGAGHHASGDREHTQPVARQSIVGIDQSSPARLVERPLAAGFEDPGADRENRARRALGIRDDLVPHTMEVGHQLALAREGQFRERRSIGRELRHVDSGGVRRPKHRQIHRIAARRLRLARRFRRRAAGEGRGLEHAHDAGLSNRLGVRTVEWHVVLRGPHTDDCHLTGRERSCLVGADDGRRSQRFDGGQPSDEGVSLRHPVDAHGQRDRRHGRQRLRHGGDGERDGRFDRDVDRHALQGAESGDDRRHAAGQPDEPAAQHVEAPLERRLFDSHRADERADAPDFCR